MYSVYKLNKQFDNIQLWCTPFPILNWSVVPCKVLTVASLPTYRFLRRQVRWSGIPISLRIFHSLLEFTVEGFCVVNGAKVDVFLEFSCFFYDPTNVGNLISGSSAFSISSLRSGSSQYTYCWSWLEGFLSMTLLACKVSTTVWQFEHSLALPLFGIGMKTELFQSCGHCWVFKFAGIECNTFTASSFRIWNTSSGIPSPPLVCSDAS